MADITMTLVPWPTGTPVSAYPRRSEQMLDNQPPTMIPAVATQLVAADASLTYSDLDDGEYWAAAPLGETWRYIHFLAQTEEGAVPEPEPEPEYAYAVGRAIGFIESMLEPLDPPTGTSTISAPDYPPGWSGAMSGTFALRDGTPTITGDEYDGYSVESHVITDVDYLIESQPAKADGTFSFATAQPGEKRFVLRRDADGASLADTRKPYLNVRSYVVNEGQPGWGTAFVQQSYVYDQAVALCAAVALGRGPLAQRLAQGLLLQQTSGGIHDGGFVFSSRQEAPTYGDTAYRTGAHAIAVYALLTYLAAYPNDRSRDFMGAATRAVTFMQYQIDPTRQLVTGGWGVYTPDGSGGQDFDPDVKLTWMSLEHNFDAYHAFKLADAVIGGYSGAADSIGNAIQTLLWDPTNGRYLQGLKEDDEQDTADPLDAHSWGAIFCASYGDDARARAIMAPAQLAPYAFTRATPEGVSATGYSVNYDEPGYPGAVPTVWSEGTFGVAYAWARLNETANWQKVMDGIVPSQAIDGSYYYVTDSDPSQDLYPYHSTVGAAWSILAALGHGIWGFPGDR